MDAFGTIPMDGTALSEQNPLMGTVWNNSPALDSYADLAGTPKPTQSINSLSAFTPELEPLSTSTTQMEIDFAGSVIPLSPSTASNLASVNSTFAADSLTGVAADAPVVGDLKTGEYIALVSLGNLPGSDVLDGRTSDGTVGLAPSTDNPYSGTRWRVTEVSDGVVTLENQGANPSPDYRFLDGRTNDGSVGLAPNTNAQYSGTQWRVSRVNDFVVTLENQGAIPSDIYNFLDGRTGDGTVGLAPSTDNPFTGTRWRVFNFPSEFGSFNPITAESRENVTPDFLRKVFDISERLDTVPEYLMAVMAFETGGSYSQSVESAGGSGAVGLIQFLPSTAQQLGTTTAQLASLTAIQQLDYVEQYLSPYKGRLTRLEDVYMAVFAPVGVGESPEYALYRAGTQAYQQNIGLDTNRDGVIIVREATDRVREKLPGAALFSGNRVA